MTPQEIQAIAEKYALKILRGEYVSHTQPIEDAITEATDPAWTQNFPTESGLYWWWSGDEDSKPIPVHLGISLPGRQVFAQIDQYGWTRAQDVEEMGGWWMLLATPDQPTREQVQQAYDHQLPTDLEDEWEECDNCDGKCIADYGEGDETCRTCEGEGRINVSARKRETREAAEEDRADAGRDNHE